MEGIKGKMILEEKFMIYEFDSKIKLTNYPEINSVFITLRGFDHRQMLYRDGAGTPWKLQIGTDGLSYGAVLKRLLLTWDRVMNATPEEVRSAYDESLNHHHGHTTLPYREPVDVDVEFED